MTPRSRIREIIQQHRRFLILSHTNPDGDAIGSLFALGCVLRSLGKEVFLCNESGVPERFAWLAAADREVLQEPPPEGFDWAFALDCGSAARMGEGETVERGIDLGHTVNIDHHQDNPGFAAINWVEARSSVGEMIALLARDLDIPLSGALGEAIYLALVTDSGFFSYSNTTPESLRVAADIIEQGLDLDLFNANLQRQWSLGTVKLHGLALQNAYLAEDGRVGVVTVDERTLERIGATWGDSENLVDYMRRVRGVQVSLCLKGENSGRIKMSLRSWGEVDVSAIASSLGGGGHVNAAGGVLHTDMPDAEKRVLRRIAQELPEPYSETSLNPGAH